MYAGPTRANFLNTGDGWQATENWNLAQAGLIYPYFTTGQGRDSGLRLADLNGDGKTDLLESPPEGDRHAYLNTGSGWRRDDRWAPPFPFAAGSPPEDAGIRLVDLNGDGLTDLFYDAFRPGRGAYLNTGRGWRREMAWNSGLFEREEFHPAGVWRPADFNGDGLVDLMRHVEGQVSRVLINTGGGWKQDNRYLPERFLAGRQVQDLGARFADLNGDGMTDIVYGKPGDAEFAEIWTSAGPRWATPPDLLVRVENGLGGSATLTYRPSAWYDNTGGDRIEDLPFVLPTVASQTLDNGMDFRATTQFTYAWGKYNAAEREFLGFGWAKATDPIGTKSETWFDQNVHRKGRPIMQEIRDAQNRLFSRTENTWACRDDLFGGRVHFAFLRDTTATVFDGDATSKQTKVEFAYDDTGNLTRKVELGDTSATGDERTTAIEYARNPTAYLMSFPSHTVTTDSASNKLSESWVYYDGNPRHTDAPTRGLPTKQEAWAYNPITRQERRVATQATYDAYGNPLTSTDPLERRTTTAYDEATKTFPVRVTNHVGHVLETSYHPGTGNVLSTTDPNRQVTQNRYDPLGRLIKVIGPEDSEAEPGVRYEYDLTRLPTRVTKQVKAAASPVSYYATHSFADGLGRTIQTRSPAQDPAQQIVSGCPEFGPRGEVTAQFLSYFAPNSTAYSAPPAQTPKVRYEYDAVGRLTRTIDPDEAVTTTAYDDWTVSVTNANRQTTTRTSDAYGRLIRVTEPATSDHGAATTTYAYDPSGRLTQVTDVRGNATRMTYDSLGRKLRMDDFDMGRWEYAYDDAGNLLRQTDAKGQILEFTYDALNRLTQKRGKPTPQDPWRTLAGYTFDDTAQPNRIGRLSRVTDPTGSTEFFYDRLGRETRTVKTIAGAPYTVQRQYDPLNRLTQLTYPDGAQVRYDYSPQGIRRIQLSLDGGQTFSDLLTSANYNAANETLQMALGNGTTCNFAYDPRTLRIASIRTTDARSQTLQDFSYAFDPVGNLQTLTDRVNSASQSFQYDPLNRLKVASGAYGGYTYRYDALGNVLTKDTSLTLNYTHPTKPHAVTETRVAGQDPLALAYDPNGNLQRKGQTEFTYDLENRLAEVVVPQRPVRTTTAIASGGPASSGNFRLWAAIGEPAVGSAQAANAQVHAGFLAGIGDPAQVPQPRRTRFLYDGDGGRVQMTVDEGLSTQTTTFVGSLYEAHPEELTKLHVFFGPTRLVTLTRSPQLLPGGGGGGNAPFALSLAHSGRGEPVEPRTLLAKLADRSPFALSSSKGERLLRRLFQSIEEFFVGKAYADPPPPGVQIRWLHGDHLGSVNLVTDHAGRRMELAEHTPFGGLSRLERETGAPANQPFRFTGKRLDDSTGLYYFGARYYDPQIGRFIQPDTIVQAPADPQTLNRYTYCRNNLPLLALGPDW